MITHLAGRKTLTAFLAVIGLLAVACGADATSTPLPVPTSTAITQVETPTPSPTAVNAALVSSGIRGGDPEFNRTALVWQSYWLSRDQFGPFVMASGMGIPFQPPVETLMQGMAMVAQNPADPVMLPTNMMPLQAIYASGSASLIKDPRDFEPLDFEAFRLGPGTFDTTISVRGQAETMLKESQWARNFASEHFGEPGGDFGAQQRFIGLVVSMLAQMQGQYAMQELKGEDGLYHDSDGNLDYIGNWVMLHTMADIAGLTAAGRYANSDSNPMFAGAADGLFQTLGGRVPDSPQEAAAAIRALAYFAWVNDGNESATAAITKLQEIAESLQVTSASEGVVEKSAAIVGLTAAAVAADDRSYLPAATALFESISGDFDADNGVFNSKQIYTTDDVAWIIGGLNFFVQQVDGDIMDEGYKILLAFYESTISLAGLQLSAPPGKNGAMAGPWELNLPSVVYYHPADTPPPPLVGKLTVPGEEITWDGSEWQMTSDRFVPASAMHLANELNWVGPHLGSIPFPQG
ncbi:MAG: hypothetical protein O2913_06620 [Chloroflexi bacterium]|nr:hypothetical protein [Chloroflexota bacterium]